MRRFMLAIVIVSAFAATGSARAHCARTGEYDQVYVRFGSVEIYGYQFGNFATGPVTACDDGTVSQQPAREGMLSIKQNGVEVCHRTDVTVSADPFGFGIGIHPGTPGTCGADVSLGTVVWPSAKPETITGAYTPDALDPAGAGEGGANAGALLFSPAEGRYWLGGVTTPLTPEPLGWFTRGAKVELQG